LYPSFIVVIKYGYDFGCVLIKSRVCHKHNIYTVHDKKS